MNVLPPLSAHNATDDALGASVLLGKVDVPHPTGSVFLSDAPNGVLGHCGSVMVFSGLRSDCPPLRGHITGVFGGGSEEQVARVDAGRVVALVADEHPVWNREPVHIVEDEGSPVCGLLTESDEGTVLAPHRLTPRPAVVWASDKSPGHQGDGSIIERTLWSSHKTPPIGVYHRGHSSATKGTRVVAGVRA